MDRLRAAEKSAKEKKTGLWENYSAPAKGGSAQGLAANGSAGPVGPQTKGTSFDATVVRIWNADTISVIEKGDASGKERRMTLASVRAPR
jgi:staphylococcal nuclease domain-containing protein 1